MYCVRFKSDACGVGYIRPWNSVRDGETYSLTYIPTSFINGIEVENNLSGKILRHKLRFNGMTTERFISEERNGYVLKGKGKDRKYTYKKTRSHAPSTIHQLSQPEIILGFEKFEDAETMSKNCIYVGQTQYLIFPYNFDGSDSLDGNVIVELDDEEFDKLSGTETFASTEYDDDAIYCGNNRQKNNEKMYIRIVRTK